MNYNNVFMLMVLCHTIDDFVFQPIILSKLKQKQWWIDTCKEKGLDFSFYAHDYIAGLLIHAMSWSTMIMLPLILLNPENKWLILGWLINVAVHSYVDHLKANTYKLTLVNDQLIHILQIMITILIFVE